MNERSMKFRDDLGETVKSYGEDCRQRGTKFADFLSDVIAAFGISTAQLCTVMAKTSVNIKTEQEFKDFVRGLLRCEEDAIMNYYKEVLSKIEGIGNEVRT